MATGILGPGLVTAQAGVQKAQESHLLQQMQSATGSGQKLKIEKCAREFEALLLQGWLQKAEQSFATVPGADDDSDSAGQSTMTNLGVQALSGALAASGGIGLGAIIEKAMLTLAEKSQSPGTNPVENHHFPLNSGARDADRMAVSRKGSG